MKNNASILRSALNARIPLELTYRPRGEGEKSQSPSPAQRHSVGEPSDEGSVTNR